MAARFIPIQRDTDYLLPPSVQDWLPDGHLTGFVVEVVTQLDLSALEAGYLNSFRKDHWDAIESAFQPLLRIAAELGVLTLGGISLDGTKIKANASKHSALSYGHAQQLEARIQSEIAELKRRAESADGLPDDLSLPEELQHREVRLNAIRRAKAEIKARAAEQDAAAQAEYTAKRDQRDAQRRAGKPPRGKDPQPPPTGPKDRDQVNLTDAESRILPAGSDFV